MRRILAAIVICLLLSALTSIGVAWAIAVWMPIPMYPREISGAFQQWERGWHYASLSKFGLVDVWWGNLAADYSHLPVEEAVELIRARQANPRTRWPLKYVNEPPRWGTFAEPRQPPRRVLGSDTGFGWPMLCLWYQTTADYVGNATVGDSLHGGYLLEGQVSSVRGRGFQALPLRPIWRGLILNMGFYAALWWLVLFAPGIMRRHLRQRRGCCPACGYDISSNPAAGCPECGWRRAAKTDD